MLGFFVTLVYILLFFLSFFLIVLVLIQRGRGGGLTGALGGMGGQSAFGTKAGDLFTRITVFVASTWIVLCIFLFWAQGRIGNEPSRYPDSKGDAPQSAPLDK